MTHEEIAARIRAAITAAKAAGIRIERLSYGDFNTPQVRGDSVTIQQPTCACPLTAVALASPKLSVGGNVRALDIHEAERMGLVEEADDDEPEEMGWSEGPDEEAFVDALAKSELGVTDAWIAEFISGFDHVPVSDTPPTRSDSRAFLLGREIAAEVFA